ncbi:MAG: hypothetical protein JWR15_3219 [Prosthecobacter sp.]|nr:hypothetical protein [Prosthecobacter sp.]
MQLHRHLCIPTFLAVCVLAAFSCAPAAVPGQRVFYTGHSFHMFVPAMIEEMVKTTDIQGHKLVGKQGIGGSRVIQHWQLADDKNFAKKALMGGEVDVFTMAPHLLIPDEGITNFVNLGLEHNPRMRFLLQASWYPFDVAAPAPGQPDLRIKDNSKRDDAKIADLQAAVDGWRAQLEAQAAELNQKHGKTCVFIVPVGDAVVKLRAMVLAGEFPGITKQSALFRDPIGHGQGHIMALAAYCNFAALYQMSPVGHTAPERSVSPEQHAILQKIAWDTVSKYPPAGVKS